MIVREPKYLDPVVQNAEIFAHRRGAGYWLWKPYLILKTLKRMSPGDVLFYCDSGAYFIESAAPLIEIAQRVQDVVPFHSGHPEWMWSKRDALILLDADDQKYWETPQRLAAFMVLRCSDRAVDFAARYLSHCLDPRILTDRPNELGKPNLPGFQENRHDQTVFSLLSKKDGYPCYRNPSTPPGNWPDCAPSEYPKIIEHTRARHYRMPALRGLVGRGRSWIFRRLRFCLNR